MAVDLSALLAAAADGDSSAWEEIVGRFEGLVWSVARGFRLNAADASDVVQATWLRLIEGIDTVRDADRLGAWLATTARREALRLIQRGGRVVPVGGTDFDRPAETVDPALRLITEERDASLWLAFRGLSSACQRLLRVLMADPPPSYAEAAAALAIPVGSIGPTRARCLDALRRQLDRHEARA